MRVGARQLSAGGSMVVSVVAGALLAWGKKTALGELEQQVVTAFRPHVLSLVRRAAGISDTPAVPPASDTEQALRYAYWAAAELTLGGALRQLDVDGTRGGDRLGVTPLLQLVEERRRAADAPRGKRPAPTWGASDGSEVTAAAAAGKAKAPPDEVADVAQMALAELRDLAKDAQLGALPQVVVDAFIFGVADAAGKPIDFASLLTAFFLEAVRTRPELFREMQLNSAQAADRKLSTVAADVAATRALLSQLADGAAAPLHRTVSMLRHSPDLRTGMLMIEPLAPDKGIASSLTKQGKSPARMRLRVGQRARFAVELAEPMVLLVINVDYDGGGHAASLGPLLGIPAAPVPPGRHVLPAPVSKLDTLPVDEPLGQSTLLLLATSAPIAQFDQPSPLSAEELGAIIDRFHSAAGPRAAGLVDYEVLPMDTSPET